MGSIHLNVRSGGTKRLNIEPIFTLRQSFSYAAPVGL